MPELDYWICRDFVNGKCKWNQHGCNIDHPNNWNIYADSHRRHACQRDGGVIHGVTVVRVAENMVIKKY